MTAPPAPERIVRSLSITSAPSHNRWTRFAADLWRAVGRHRVIDGAAVLAFYFLLAVFPAAIFVLSVLPSLHIPHLQEAILDLLHQALPQQSADLFQVTVKYVASRAGAGLLTFGLLFTLWSASTGIYAIMDQLNVIFGIVDRRPFWKARGTAVLLMLIFFALVIASLSLVVFGGVVQSWTASIIGWSRLLRIFFATLRWIIIAIALLLALALIYRFGPDVKRKFRFISIGNVVAVILIALASVAFRFYVSNFGDYSLTYGSLASMIILMLWMYMASLALLLGCEINALRHPPNSA